MLEAIAECDAAIKQPARQLAHTLDTHTCTDHRCKQCTRKGGKQ